MTDLEKKLIKDIREINRRSLMCQNKIRAIHELSPTNEELDKAFEAIEKAFSEEPETKADYKSDRQT